MCFVGVYVIVCVFRCVSALQECAGREVQKLVEEVDIFVS